MMGISWMIVGNLELNKKFKVYFADERGESRFPSLVAKPI